MNPLSTYKQFLLGLATDTQLRREGRKLDTRLREHALNHNVIYLREPGTDPDTPILPDGRSVIVSLTSFGPRIRYAATAIESVMEQTLLPNRIILWVSDSLEHSPWLIPASLRRLQKRGLEIRYTADIGPATKLIPALRAFPDDVIITIDDDCIYDTDMIDRLVTAHRLHPEAVCAGRIDHLAADNDGRSLRIVYNQADRYYLTRSPQIQPIALGIGGVLYPPHAMHPDVFDTDLMMRLCPKADDLWYKTMQLLAGTPVYPINDADPTDTLLLICAHYRQELALHTTNYLGGRDNVQLRALSAHYPQILDHYKDTAKA